MTRQPLREGSHQTEQGWEVMASHEIQGVTPNMLTWWWDHIDTTERYVRWHPSDHVSFAWLIDPATHGHVGAVHRVSEYLNGLPAKPAIFEIRWEDPGDVEAEYARVLLATARGQGELAGLEIRLMHEYEQMPGGTRMRSHFHLPPETPAALVNALYEHNRQEMAYLTSFLPTLYQKEASHEEIW